jgi:transcriptional regulator with XRE-family HTH domain
MVGTRVGRVVRAVRRRQRLTQRAIADRAGVSQPTISRIEAGHVDTLTLRQLERICAVLDLSLDLVPRWRGADLDRLVNARHAELHERVARTFARRWPEWQLAPEVSFSIYGERGVIDILAWCPQHRALLVIELKTAIVDPNELAGTVDRKRRLARKIAKDRGWDAQTIGVWVIVEQGRTNRRHLRAHEVFLRNAFPHGAARVREWLLGPTGSLSAITLESFGSR